MKLTKEYKNQAQEWTKCKNDFRYFVDNYCYIEDKKTKQAILFKLWPGQAAIVPLILLYKLLISIKARQLGITWLIVAYVLWRAIFHMHEYIIIISSKEDTAVEFLDRVKFIFDLLPHWMKPAVGKRTTTELFFGKEVKDKYGHVKTEGLNSRIKSIPSTPDAGQSKTISLLVMDESALNPYCKEIWSSAKPTLEHADGQAIIISNPTKIAPGWAWTKTIYKKSLEGFNNFKRIFLGWDTVPGRGDDFIEQQRRDGLTDEDISMQYPTTEAEALESILGCFFSKELNKHKHPKVGESGSLILSKEKDYTYSDIDFAPGKDGLVTIWEMPYDRQPDWDGTHWKKRYAIGSDVGEGLGRSFSVAYVCDRKEDKIVARMVSNIVDANEWSKRLAELATFYHNDDIKALVCAERTGAGQTTVKELMKMNVPQYLKLIPGKAGSPVTKQYGWNETRQTKWDLCNDIKKWLNKTENQVPCELFLSHASSFVLDHNGQLGGEGDEFDDAVIGLGCTVQAKIFMGGSPENVGQGRVTLAKKEEILSKLDSSSRRAQFALEDYMERLEQQMEGGYDW